MAKNAPDPRSLRRVRWTALHSRSSDSWCFRSKQIAQWAPFLMNSRANPRAPENRSRSPGPAATASSKVLNFLLIKNWSLLKVFSSTSCQLPASPPRCRSISLSASIIYRPLRRDRAFSNCSLCLLTASSFCKIIVLAASDFYSLCILNFFLLDRNCFPTSSVVCSLCTLTASVLCSLCTLAASVLSSLCNFPASAACILILYSSASSILLSSSRWFTAQTPSLSASVSFYFSSTAKIQGFVGPQLGRVRKLCDLFWMNLALPQALVKAGIVSLQQIIPP